MDLSNLHTSLREVGEGLDESTSRRRAAHLRAAEDDLNAHFRSSALQLTTLYRQAVSSSKASYEKGYAHALAHVLDLWDADRDWLKGYLQRRIEAIEVGNDDEVEEPRPQMDAGVRQQDGDESFQQQNRQSQGARYRGSSRETEAASRPPVAAANISASPVATSSRTLTRNLPHSTPTKDSTSQSHRSSGKRTRSHLYQHQQQQQQPESASVDTERRLHRLPYSQQPHPSSSSFYSTPTTSADSSVAHSSSLPFSSSFDFSIPMSHSSTRFGATSAAASSVPSRGSAASKHPKSESGGVIKISNPALQRRRLKRMGGLRAGRDRILEINENAAALDPDEMVDEDDPDAWTDDEAEHAAQDSDKKRKKRRRHNEPSDSSSTTA
ncbi:hypothetical protein BCV70DRAFT_202003 [Testicularia cyperi]|uniref:Uncharacterized protein n=1 Tax=Testicularia cyperi TaxID=1882483 RepID=A0A317XLE2_9BASI|nr:hypothetical protein BCV70DRAFT_202003 [Testicularia cyperi]